MPNENTDTCETVKIVSDDAPGGFVVINATDKQPQNIIFEEAAAAEESLQKRHSKR